MTHLTHFSVSPADGALCGASKPNNYPLVTTSNADLITCIDCINALTVDVIDPPPTMRSPGLERICNRLTVDQDAIPTRIETDYLLSALIGACEDTRRSISEKLYELFCELEQMGIFDSEITGVVRSAIVNRISAILSTDLDATVVNAAMAWLDTHENDPVSRKLSDAEVDLHNATNALRSARLRQHENSSVLRGGFNETTPPPTDQES